VVRGIRTPAKGAEDGFTLVELLVVILVIGLLAAIAIPVFFNQTAKAKDTSAKADVRQLAAAVEACRLERANYSQCDTAAELEDVENLSFGYAEGQVGVVIDSNGYTAYAVSKAKTNGVNHVFGWQRAGTTVSRICVNLALQPLHSGGCVNSGW
jgi:prepilin-type N-terminal cleavage/methylation domain-containing protein